MLSKGVMKERKIKKPFDWKGFVVDLSKNMWPSRDAFKRRYERKKNKKAFRLERLRGSRANLFTCQKTGDPPGILSKGIMQERKIKKPFDWKGFVVDLSTDRWPSRDAFKRRYERKKNKKAFRLERLRGSRANLFTCQKTGDPPGILSKGIMQERKIKKPFDWKGFVGATGFEPVTPCL
jgi:hypothetical protein